MLEVELDIAAAKPSAAGAVKRRLMVMRVSMPAVATSMIMIDSNIPRLSAMQRSSDGRFGRFHVDHDEFDVVFGVLAADISWRGLLTPIRQQPDGVASSLIDPLADQRGGGMYMTGMFADARLTLVVDLPDKTQDVSGRITASLVEARALPAGAFCGPAASASAVAERLTAPETGPCLTTAPLQRPQQVPASELNHTRDPKKRSFMRLSDFSTLTFDCWHPDRLNQGSSQD